MTQASCIHPPSKITVLNLMGPSIHVPVEFMGREQSCIGILIRLFQNRHISFPVISPTCSPRFMKLFRTNSDNLTQLFMFSSLETKGDNLIGVDKYMISRILKVDVSRALGV